MNAHPVCVPGTRHEPIPKTLTMVLLLILAAGCASTENYEARLKARTEAFGATHEVLMEPAENPRCEVRIAGEVVISKSGMKLFGGGVKVPSVAMSAAASGEVTASSGSVKTKEMSLSFLTVCKPTTEPAACKPLETKEKTE